MVDLESSIREFVERTNPVRTSIFVAACAERMAQLFTGLVGADGARLRDVELAIDCLNLLWEPSAQAPWDQLAERLRSLPELTGDEESTGLLAYADDAAAALYYAVRYRQDGALELVISCSNSALNSAEFISDLLSDGVDRYEIEVAQQEADIASLSSAEDPDEELVTSMRDRARELSRTRLAEFMSALPAP